MSSFKTVQTENENHIMSVAVHQLLSLAGRPTRNFKKRSRRRNVLKRRKQKRKPQERQKLRRRKLSRRQRMVKRMPMGAEVMMVPPRSAAEGQVGWMNLKNQILLS